MLPSFFGLNSVTRALLAQQEAVDVVNQNIANASTPGYSRQEAILAASDPYTAPAFDRPTFSGQLGQGVQVSRIDRFQDELLNSQIRDGQQSVGQMQSMDDYFTQIQAIYNDPSDVAINSAATNFFNAVHDLSNNPESGSARQAMQEQGSTLASAISTRYNQLTTLQSDLNTKVQSIVDDINSTITQVASLNTKIAEVTGVGDNANDLKDQRDLLIDHLSTLVDIRDVKNLDGTDTVQMNGRFLVNKDQAYTLQTLSDASSTALIKPLKVFWSDDVNRFQLTHPGYDPITGKNLTTGAQLQATDTPPLSVQPALITTGSLAGAMQMRDQVIQDTLLPQLNELADSLTNTQVLSSNTGLTANTVLTGSASSPDSFVITLFPPATVGAVTGGKPTQLTITAAAGGTVQSVVNQINASSFAPYIHASLNAAGQLQIDTIMSGSLVKVDQASAAASKDFGFSQSVADGFNMVHAQGYGLDTPAQITGGLSGLTLATPINVGANDAINITGPDGQTFTVVVPSPIAPATQNTVQDLITAVNGSGLSHGVKAGLDGSGHFILYAAPTVFGADGTVVGEPAQIVGANATPIDSQGTQLAGGATLQIQGPNGTKSFVTGIGSVGSLIQQINAANLGLTASIDSLGRFQLSSNLPGSSQSITLTTSGAAADLATLGLTAGTTTVNGLSSGFLPSSSISVSLPATPGNTVTEFLGSIPPSAGPPPPYVTASNANQFFFQGAAQTVTGQVMTLMNSTSIGGPFNFSQPPQAAQLSVTLLGATTFGAVNVTGIDDATGNVVTETLNFTANGSLTTQHFFRSITSVAPAGIAPGTATLGLSATLPQNQADTAGSIAVDSRIMKDTTLIATSAVPGAPGNADNALALLNVQQQAIIGKGQAAVTFGDFYSANTSTLGAAASDTHTSLISQQQLVQSLNNQKQALVGVSTDQEAATLVALQHAYEAAARAITSQDSMLNTIINGMGLVGLAGSGG